MTVNLSNRSVSARAKFTVEDTKDSKGLWVSWSNRFHHYDLCPNGKKTATDLFNGNASDDDWILLIDGMHEESVGSAAFLKRFLETHTPNLVRKIRFHPKEETSAVISAKLEWNGYSMSETSFIGTYYKN